MVIRAQRPMGWWMVNKRAAAVARRASRSRGRILSPNWFVTAASPPTETVHSRSASRWPSIRSEFFLALSWPMQSDAVTSGHLRTVALRIDFKARNSRSARE